MKMNGCPTYNFKYFTGFLLGALFLVILLTILANTIPEPKNSNRSG